jgi:hypothetical protein
LRKPRLRVIENGVLRRIFGPKSEEVTGGWRKLHNDRLHKLSSLLDIARIIKSGSISLGEGKGGMHWREERCVQNSGQKI